MIFGAFITWHQFFVAIYSNNTCSIRNIHQVKPTAGMKTHDTLRVFTATDGKEIAVKHSFSFPRNASREATQIICQGQNAQAPQGI